MKRILTGLTAISLVALSAAGRCDEAVAAPAAPAETGPFATGNFSSTLSFTTNYMFRGISNSDGPAIQGSFDWTYEGFFLGAWGSNTEFSDSNLEIDYYGGYRWGWSGLDFVLQGIWYTFPGDNKDTSDGFDPAGGLNTNYAEANVGVSHTFEGEVAPSVGVNVFYSPDTFAEDGGNITVQGNFGLTLPAAIGAYAVVGYTKFDGDLVTGLPEGLGGYDYLYFQVGVNKVVKGFKLDLSYVGTDKSTSLEGAYANVPTRLGSGDNFRDLIDSQVVFSVSRTF